MEAVERVTATPNDRGRTIGAVRAPTTRNGVARRRHQDRAGPLHRQAAPDARSRPSVPRRGHVLDPSGAACRRRLHQPMDFIESSHALDAARPREVPHVIISITSGPDDVARLRANKTSGCSRPFPDADMPSDQYCGRRAVLPRARREGVAVRPAAPPRHRTHHRSLRCGGVQVPCRGSREIHSTRLPDHGALGRYDEGIEPETEHRQGYKKLPFAFASCFASSPCGSSLSWQSPSALRGASPAPEASPRASGLAFIAASNMGAGSATGRSVAQPSPSWSTQYAGPTPSWPCASRTTGRPP